MCQSFVKIPEQSNIKIIITLNNKVAKSQKPCLATKAQVKIKSDYLSDFGLDCDSSFMDGFASF